MSGPQEWSATAADLPAGASAKFPLSWRGTKVEGFVINFEGRYRAYVNRCAHAGTPLDWWPNEFFTDDARLLVCATHGALFEPDSGRCAGGPCGGGALWPLVVRLEGDRVIVTTRPEDADGATGSLAEQAVTDEPRPNDRAAVQEANERFYRAFESLDLAEMDQVWAHGDHVACVHPGWNRLHGWDAVRRSWAAIFQSTSEMRFTITDVRVELRDDLGWVHCTENILSETRGSLSITAILATNVFERHAARWLLVHHHASHILAPPDPGPEAA